MIFVFLCLTSLGHVAADAIISFFLWLSSLPVCVFAHASLIAQLVKNLPAMQETPVRFLGGEDPLEKG